MKRIFDADIPLHLSAIPELDLTGDLREEPLESLWFRLAEENLTRERVNNVQSDVSRRSLLITPEEFSELFGHLDCIGNVLQSLAEPQSSLSWDGDSKKYSYSPFYRFKFPFTSIMGEPLILFRHTAKGPEPFISPDLTLYLGLERRTPQHWWDPSRSTEALRICYSESHAVIEIRSAYLLKYLGARQEALLVGHYRHAHFFNPPKNAIDAFVKKDEVLGSAHAGGKAIFQNWGRGPPERFT
jgi:hypothetical protein